MDDFKAFMIKVSERLTAEDVEKIVYGTNLPNDLIERRSRLDVLHALEKKNTFSAQSLTGLSELMRSIGRIDLASLVEEYRPPPDTSLPCHPRLGDIGHSISDLGPRCSSFSSVGATSCSDTGSLGDRRSSMPTPSMSAPQCPTNNLRYHRRWTINRKELNEDIYEHKCLPFTCKRTVPVETQVFPGVTPPCLHLTLYPSGLEGDRGTSATLEAQVELPLHYRGEDTSSFKLTLKASAHDFPGSNLIGEKEVTSTLNVQKVMVFGFISHEALKFSRSKQIVVEVRAWAAPEGTDQCKVEPVEDDFQLVSLPHGQ